MPDTQPMRGGPRSDALREAILRMAAARGPSKTICPSEVARAMASDGAWRDLMVPTHREAARLAREGRVRLTRHGEPLDPGVLGGIYRIAIRA